MASPRSRRPTLVDVARRARVALGTASNVLNGRGSVGADLERRVRDAMDKLGYSPDGVAQSLRRRRSRVVGICVPSTASAYFAALQDAFEDIAAHQGYELMQVLSRGDPALELRRVEAMLARRADGLILIPAGVPGATFAAIAASGVPAVIVDRAFDDPRFDYVTIDERAAMRDATASLVAAGHRRILFAVRAPSLVTTRERIAGFRAALRTHKAHGAVIVREPDDAEFTAQIAKAMAARMRPTAIIVSNSALALSLLKSLRALGLAVARDVSLLLFDEPEWADVVTPPLAVVRHPTAAIARTAWELLIHRMRTPRAKPQRVVYAATQVGGASIAVRRAR
ncbi:MAG TPA: LacI family DNA-binding transcriptional regulator [Casimicrobiaceae bacterium]|nr:LacI family DNA-binding transcriptional regulator [Casimicrobiaceae bacterium]